MRDHEYEMLLKWAGIPVKKPYDPAEVIPVKLLDLLSLIHYSYDMGRTDAQDPAHGERKLSAE